MSDQIAILLPLLVPLAGVFGLVIGSFLNVVIYRVPNDMSVVSPPSACPGCKTPIRGRDNIPLLSWVLLRGRCRDCSEPISVRYPLVEATTGLLFAGITWWSLTYYPSLAPLLLYLSAIGVALFMIDLDCRRLPDQIVLPSYPVVAVLLFVAGVLDRQWPWYLPLLSALVWLVFFGVPWLVTTGRGMGFGDVKLAPLLGAALGAVGWGASLIGLFSGFVFGAVVSVLLLLVGVGGRKIPYGPYMLTGALFGLVAGDAVAHWYLNLFGLA